MIHETAIVEEGAFIGDGVMVWAYTQVRDGASIGEGTSVGSHTYIDTDVVIGARCKIQTGVRVFRGVIVENGAFLGPNCVITNDLRPRAINADGSVKGNEDWNVATTRIGTGAALGASSVIVAGADIGAFALVGAGSTVTRPVHSHAIVVGNPAHQIGWACHCGERLKEENQEWRCQSCQKTVSIPSI